MLINVFIHLPSIIVYLGTPIESEGSSKIEHSPTGMLRFAVPIVLL